MIYISLGGILIGLAIIGIILFLIQRKRKLKLNKFQLLAVGSGIGIPVFAILHNVVYGLGIVWFGDGFWAGGEEPVLFIITLIVCPIGLLVGVVGSVILRRHRRQG